jgi:hypothetical protein
LDVFSVFDFFDFFFDFFDFFKAFSSFLCARIYSRIGSSGSREMTEDASESDAGPASVTATHVKVCLQLKGGALTYNRLWFGVQTLFFGFLPFSIFAFYFWLLVVLYMVHTQRLAQNISTIEVIDSQYGGPLIFIHKECKSLGLPSGFVSRKIDIHNFPEPLQAVQ